MTSLKDQVAVNINATTKSSLKAIADSFWNELNIEGIRVLCVYLARTATPMQEIVCENEGKDYNPQLFIQPENIARTIVNIINLLRNAKVTDINILPLFKT